MSSTTLSVEHRTSLLISIGRLLLVVALIGSCAAPGMTPTLPAPTRPVEPTRLPTPAASSAPIVPAPLPSSPTVLAACDTNFQSRAMRAAHIPDWNALGLNACYELTLDLLPDKDTYTGTARVTFTNLTGSDLPDLVFRVYPNAPLIYGGKLEITTAQVDGARVTPEVFLSDQTAVRLRLDRPLQDGASAVVELAFAGRVPRDFGSSSAYGIFNQADDGPVLALANWYPILAVWREGEWHATPVIGEGDAVVSETALYRVRITAPTDWEVVTTGLLLSAQSQGDAKAQHDFVTGPVRDFMVLASPAFEAREAQFEDVRVVHWGLPGGEAGWEDALEVARDSIAIFEERFGPYPYAELDAAAVSLQNASGVEYPGLILIGAGLYTDEDGRLFLLAVVAHEVAHQWWYAVVGNDVLAAPWQDEALTTFSSFLYFEEHSPAFYAGMRLSFTQQVEDFQQEEGDEPVAQPLDAFRGRSGAYGTIVYLKGALFFAELRERLGDDAFFQALQTYYARGRYTIASPDALLSAFKQACGCDLDAFYDEWGVAPP